MLPLSTSSLVAIDGRGNRKPGRPLADIADNLDRTLAKGAHAAFELCAQIMQVEVVKRCPVLTGQMKAAFSHPDAVGKNEDGKWAFGLLTPELRKNAYYWQWVEYGTKPRPLREKGYFDRKTRRKYKRTYPATSGRSPQPFFRPGIAVARAKFSLAAGMALGMALQGMSRSFRGAHEGPTNAYQIGITWTQKVVYRYKEDDRL